MIRLRGSSRGYTLVEMLLSLALFGSIMVGVAGMLWSTSTSQREARARARVDRVALRVMRVLARDIAGQLTYVEGGAYHDPGFAGEDASDPEGAELDKLTLLTHGARFDLALDWDAGLLDSRPPRSRRSDIMIVVYELVLDPETGMPGLYRRTKVLPTSTATDEDEPWQERLLAAEVTSFQLLFYDEEGNEEEAWSLEDKEGKLPTAMAVELEVDLVPDRSTDERDDLREAEADGARSIDRGRYWRRFKVGDDAPVDLSEAVLAGEQPQTEEQQQGGNQGGGNQGVPGVPGGGGGGR